MKITAFAGGVGGAKMVEGLAQVMDPQDLTVVVNTADDFIHYGLYICPDIDTVCYTLAHIVDPKKGWGRNKERWEVLNQLKYLGAPVWFKLGDKDLATHLERTRFIAQGKNLTEITNNFLRKWGLKVTVLPMSNHKISTIITTKDGKKLPFQEYFVKYSFRPEIERISFNGIDKAYTSEEVIESIQNADYVIFCPSNPFVSIDPILKTRGIKELLKNKKVIAVSPIIEGKAVKGPAAKMFFELGITPSAAAVAEHYQEIISGFILDIKDRDEIEKISRWGIITKSFDIMMSNRSERRNLAQKILQFLVNEL